MSETIVCPACGADFELAAVVRQQLEAELRLQVRKELEPQIASAREHARREAAAEVAVKDGELLAAQKRLAEAAQKEADLLRREREATDRLQQAGVELEQKLAVESKRIREETTRVLEERLTREATERMRVKDDELLGAQKRLAEASRKEADLLRREREATDRLQQAGVELEERLAVESRRIREETTRTLEERLTREETERMRVKDEELLAVQKRLGEAAQKEADLRRREREANEKLERAGVELEERLATESQRIRAEATRAVEERLAREGTEKLREKDAELDGARKLLTEATRARDQLAEEANALLRRKQELEDAAQRSKVEAERHLLEQAEAIREQLRAEAREQESIERERVKLREEQQRLQIQSLNGTIDDLKQKLTQGSQQSQGEVQELALKEVLEGLFRRDDVKDVEKGVQGADLLQTVRDEDGTTCGTIIWESKRTKHWSDEWLQKLRDDQRDQGAACAMIVTQAMPGDVKRFGLKDGVWVCEWTYAGSVATVLRAGMIQTARARRNEEGRGRKVDMLYTYLTGQEFRHRVEGAVEAFVEMRDDLSREQRAMWKHWKRRESQLLRAQENIASLWGGLQGIAGAQLTDIEHLSLPGGHAAALTMAADDGDDDALDEEASGAPRAEDGLLTDLIYRLLPEDGSAVGNKTLCDRFVERASSDLRLDAGAADYSRCKAKLLREGRIRLGRGRGGSVARVTTS